MRVNDLKEIIVSNEDYIRKIPILHQRERVLFPPSDLRKVGVFYGVRRSGKTYLLYNIFKKNPENSLYVDFEDERLRSFTIDDFQKLKDAFFELYPHLAGREVFFLLDEVQNVKDWERFARRATERENIRVFVSGSSSKMAPGELQSLLRGRAWGLEILPFSFKEYLASQNTPYIEAGPGKYIVIKNLEEYLQWGGFPEVCYSRDELQKRKIIKEYLDAMFFRDLVERNRITNFDLVETLREKILESSAQKLSLTAFYKQYKGRFPFSKESLSTYYRHFLESLIVYEAKLFSASSYQRMRNPPKLYLVDPGIARRVTSQDRGRLLENAIFLELKRRGLEIFYFQEKYECDFITRNESGQILPIQVTLELHSENEKRELDGLVEACNRLDVDRGLLLTLNEQRTLNVGKIIVNIEPAWKWLVET